MRPRTLLSALLVAALFGMPSTILAVKFPDVPSNYSHAHDIEKLTDLGVISGNPDGTFRPHDPVNRAAIVKMIYKTMKREPKKYGACFPDVEETSWYEFYVCDAAVNGYVKGYETATGKLFKPAQAVTRAEAIKMIMTIMGIPQADLSAGVTMYTDVTPTDWHASYVHTALALGILPIPGQEGPEFKPGQILERGEAAAYIWNGLRAWGELQIRGGLNSSSSSPAATGTGSAANMSEIERRAAAALRTIQQEEEALRRAEANTKNVEVPFSDTHTFDGRTPFSYQFSVGANMTVDITAAINQWNMGGLTCRLYHLGRSGFSQEYYLGFQDGKNCLNRVTLSPGTWRLQLEPEQLSPSFTVVMKPVKGDGNDGFVEAAQLPIGQVITADMMAGDLEDWFTFSVPKDPKIIENGGKELMVTVSSKDLLGCLVYPLDDVDQFGFAGPQCSKKYMFMPGTYVVGVRHASPLSTRQTYTVQVK